MSQLFPVTHCLHKVKVHVMQMTEEDYSDGKCTVC